MRTAEGNKEYGVLNHGDGWGERGCQMCYYFRCKINTHMAERCGTQSAT